MYLGERGEKSVCVCVCVREEKPVTEIERGVMYVCVTVCQRQNGMVTFVFTENIRTPNVNTTLLCKCE